MVPDIAKKEKKLYIYFKYQESTNMDKITFFKELGFSEYEAKALASLIKLKTASAKQISFESGVPQNKLYAILKQFEHEGIISYLPKEKKVYQVINFKTYIQEKIKQKEVQIKKLKKQSQEIDTNTDCEEFIFSLLKGQKTIINKLAEHNAKVKKEILGVQRNWKLTGQNLQALKKSISKGVNIK